MIETLTEQIDKYSFVLSLALVGGVMLLSQGISTRLTADRIHASAIAITLGLVAAAIVLESGESLDRDQLREWCDGKISRYKTPQRLKVVDHLPRNAMGKVTKPAVGEWFD